MTTPDTANAPSVFARRIAVALDASESVALFATPDRGPSFLLVCSGGQCVHCVSGFLDVDAAFANISRAHSVVWSETIPDSDYGDPALARPDVDAFVRSIERGATITAGPVRRVASGGVFALRPAPEPARLAPASLAPPAPSVMLSPPVLQPALAGPGAAGEVRSSLLESTLSYAPVVPRVVAPLPFRAVRRLLSVSVVLGAVGVGVVAGAGEHLPWTFRAALDPSVLRAGSVIEGPLRIASRETLLLEGRVEVVSGVLSFAPGAVLRAVPGASLEVGPRAYLEVRGTRDRPVVFGSVLAPVDRGPGDWAGVVIEGGAPIVGASGASGVVGGGDTAHGCASLRFLRIEHAGALRAGAPTGLDALAPPAALSLVGCGTATALDSVQVLASSSVGVAFVGGRLDARRLVVSGAAGPAVRFSHAWGGTLQHLLVRQGFGVGPALLRIGTAVDPPASVWNATVVGAHDDRLSRPGVVLDGAGLRLRNTLLTGLSGPALDVRGGGAQLLAESGDLHFAGIFASGIGPGGDRYADDETGSHDDDAGFDEHAFLGYSAVALSPLLALPSEAFDPLSPVPSPVRGDPVASVRAFTPDLPGLDSTARYVGAFAPGIPPWTARWTSVGFE